MYYGEEFPDGFVGVISNLVDFMWCCYESEESDGLWVLAYVKFDIEADTYADVGQFISLHCESVAKKLVTEHNNSVYKGFNLG